MFYAGATTRLLGPQTQPRMRAHDIVCLHTMVGYLSSTDDMFHRNGFGGTESHFGIGGKWGGDRTAGYDGRVFQWQDTLYTADANYQGNPRVISIETADNAPQSEEDIEKWTPAQVVSIVNVIVWACQAYDIPPVLIPDSKPGRRGIGYHRLGCEHSDGIGSHPGWLVSDGERWSLSRGKGCPGPVRIQQIHDEIMPLVLAAMNPQEEADMTPIEMWNAPFKLSQYDADQINKTIPKGGVPAKAGDTRTFRELVLYPTLSRRIESEFNDFRAQYLADKLATEAKLADILAGQAAILAALTTKGA